MEQLDKNYEYFKNNEKKFSQKYANQYIVIVDEKVVYNSEDKTLAINYIKENLKAGTFILQKCESDPNKNIQMFHSRVVF